MLDFDDEIPAPALRRRRRQQSPKTSKIHDGVIGAGAGAALLIEERSLTSLQVNPRNARTHSKKQIAQIAASIREFGFTNPVLIDDDGMILAGHGRVTAFLKEARRSKRRWQPSRRPCGGGLNFRPWHWKTSPTA